MRAVSLALLSCVAVVSSCANLNSTAMSYPPGSSGRVFLWDSQYSAGVGRDDHVCVQGALTADADSLSALLKLPDEARTQLGFDSAEEILALNPASPKTTYAANAYFAICQLAMNEPNLTPDQIVRMFETATIAALFIDTDESDLESVSSPRLRSAVDVLSGAETPSVETDDAATSGAGDGQEQELEGGADALSSQNASAE